MYPNLEESISFNLHLFTSPTHVLEEVTRQSIVVILNTLLADEALLTMKTQSAYWHVHGHDLLDLKSLFNQQFYQLITVSDDIACRVRMLGGFAISSFEEFLNYTRLEELPGEAPDVVNLFVDHEACIRYLHEDAQKCLGAYKDPDTYAILLNANHVHAEMASTLRSYIEPEQTAGQWKH